MDRFYNKIYLPVITLCLSNIRWVFVTYLLTFFKRQLHASPHAFVLNSKNKKLLLRSKLKSTLLTTSCKKLKKNMDMHVMPCKLLRTSVCKPTQSWIKLQQNCCLHGNKSVYFIIFKLDETFTDSLICLNYVF